MNELANQIVESSFKNIITILSPLQLQLVKVLEVNGPMTRNDLVKELKSARTTIYDNLIRLERMKILQKFNNSNGMIGRPLVYWKLV